MGFPQRSINKYGGFLIRVTFNNFIVMSMARPLRAHLNIFIILFTSKLLMLLRFTSLIEDISKVDKDYRVSAIIKWVNLMNYQIGIATSQDTKFNIVVFR